MGTITTLWVSKEAVFPSLYTPLVTITFGERHQNHKKRIKGLGSSLGILISIVFNTKFPVWTANLHDNYTLGILILQLFQWGQNLQSWHHNVVSTFI